MIGTVATVGFAAALVSIGYLRHDLAIGHVPLGRSGACAGITWGCTHSSGRCWQRSRVDNLGLLWVGVEATTLASALLVGFYRTKAALEAAWKYLILCTVGITSPSSG